MSASRMMGDACRGFALFLAVFVVANACGRLFGRGTEDLWWIDLTVLPGWVAATMTAAAGALLGWWAVDPAGPRWRRGATAGAACALGVGAAFNAVGFYDAWTGGSIRPGVPIPFSLVLAVVFGALLAVIAGRPVAGDTGRPGALAGVAAWACVAVALFPLAQVGFFGTTDYRRPADAVVVPGARVHEGGTLSSSLRDRVETAVELYEAGLAPRLIMSGGVDANGTDEAAAMASYAVARGVDPSAIVVDNAGVDTDSTVANALALAGPGARLLAVSQPYHLPRIKMAFRLAGADVATVPAREMQPIPRTPLFVLREVPAFWWYWARGLIEGR